MPDRSSAPSPPAPLPQAGEGSHACRPTFRRRWLGRLAAGAAIFALGAVVGSVFFGGPVVRRMGAILWVDGESYVDAVSAFRRENELLYPSQRDAQSADSRLSLRESSAAFAERKATIQAHEPQSIESSDGPRPISLGAEGMLWLAPHSQVKLGVPHEATLLRGAIYVDPSRIDDDASDTSDHVAGDFVVNVERREIVGRGARFVVTIAGDTVRVLPIYGTVEIGDRQFRPGQEASHSITKTDEPPSVRVVPRPTHAVAWLAKAMGDPPAAEENPHFGGGTDRGGRDFSVRWRPEIPGEPTYESHDWIFLVESPEDGDAMVAWARAEVVRTILDCAPADDRFSLVVAGGGSETWCPRQRPAAVAIVRQAMSFLRQTQLPGPVDLRRAMAEAATLAANARRPVLVHLGAGGPSLITPARKFLTRTHLALRDDGHLAPRDEYDLSCRGDKPGEIEAMIRLIPEQARYVGIAQGWHAATPLMRKAAATRDGYATWIAPSPNIRWQTLKVLSALAAPRLVGVRVTAASGKIAFDCWQDTLAPGDELQAVARLATDQLLPKSLEVVGRLGGREQRWTLPFASPPPDNK